MHQCTNLHVSRSQNHTAPPKPNTRFLLHTVKESHHLLCEDSSIQYQTLTSSQHRTAPPKPQHTYLLCTPTEISPRPVRRYINPLINILPAPSTAQHGPSPTHLHFSTPYKNLAAFCATIHCTVQHGSRPTHALFAQLHTTCHLGEAQLVKRSDDRGRRLWRSYQLQQHRKQLVRQGSGHFWRHRGGQPSQHSENPPPV